MLSSSLSNVSLYRNRSTMVCNTTVEDPSGFVSIDTKTMNWTSLLSVRVRPISLSANQDLQLRHMYEYDHDIETQCISHIKFYVWYEQDAMTTTTPSQSGGGHLFRTTVSIGSQIQFLMEGVYNHRTSSSHRRIHHQHHLQLNFPFQDRAAFLEENLDSSYPHILMMNLQRYQSAARLAAAVASTNERAASNITRSITPMGGNLFKQGESDEDINSTSSNESNEETNYDPNHDLSSPLHRQETKIEHRRRYMNENSCIHMINKLTIDR